MSLSRIGTPTSYQSDSQSSSFGITIPTGCDLVAVIATGWNNNDGWMGTDPISISGSGNGTVTEEQRTDVGDDEHIWLGWLIPQTTGSQTLSWSWDYAPQEGVNFYVFYYQDVNTSGDPIEDSDKVLGADDVTGLTCTTGNMLVGAVCGGYGGTPTVTGDGQTEIYVASEYLNNNLGIAEEVSETDWYSSGCSYPSAVAMVVKAGAPLTVTEETFQNEYPYGQDESIDTAEATGGTPPYSWEILHQTLQ